MKRILKALTYMEQSRSKIILSDSGKIRLNPDGWIQLKLQSDDRYSLDQDLTVRSWLTRPQSVVKWMLFQEMSVKPDNTAIRHRISDGVNDYWWDGVAWSVATDAGLHWNDEAGIRDNIGEWHNTNLQVISNLYTTDDKVTPRLLELKFVMLCDHDVYEDLIFRSLIPTLQENIKPVADVSYVMPSDSNTIALSALSVGLDVVGVEAIRGDGYFGNLLLSFDGITITLAEVISKDTQMFVRLIYEMGVTYTYHQDYVEVEKLPALVLAGFDTGRRLTPQGQENVKDMDAGTAVVFPDGVVEDFSFILMSITELGVDQQRNKSVIQEFFHTNGVIRSVGIDEEFSMIPLPPVDVVNRNNLKDYKQVNFPFEIRHVPILTSPAEDAYLIKDFKVELKTDVVEQ